MFTAKTTDLTPGDIVRVAQDGDYEILSAPVSGGPHGRWIFEAREVSSSKVQEHHAQPHFDWEVV